MTEAEKLESRQRRDYSTKEWDERSGLYYFGARYYSPEIGRWTQRDPAGTVDGLNVYAYVGGDPVGFIDPWGQQTSSDEAPLLEFTKCALYAGILMEAFIWPSYGIQDMLRHRRFETPIPWYGKRAITAGVIMAFCERYLKDASACFSEKEMIHIAANIRSVAGHYMDNPDEALKLLKDLSPEVMKVLGLNPASRKKQRAPVGQKKPWKPPASWRLVPRPFRPRL
jgi:RHS repeat-associated protein